ncbi:hypothetical protein IFM89_008641 [Coptis chinensis]|uniref:Uncharacterized protein n=1 Tax=Coptis chinensis TaxID=261450 RepID=A0A835HAF6_9MAGN|nr:hypothetical protein IFM89_008641 [Coptis chinensis]
MKTISKQKRADLKKKRKKSVVVEFNESVSLNEDYYSQMTSSESDGDEEDISNETEHKRNCQEAWNFGEAKSMCSFCGAILCIRLISTIGTDGRLYNLPTSNEVAALIVGNRDESQGHRDIIVDKKGYDLKRIDETFPSFMSMQYPLLFSDGANGYVPETKYRNGSKLQWLPPRPRKHHLRIDRPAIVKKYINLEDMLHELHIHLGKYNKTGWDRTGWALRAIKSIDIVHFATG